MEDSIVPLHKLIQRYYKLAIKEEISDFNPRFRNAFEELCKLISSLSNFVEIKDFESFLGTPKVIPLVFLNQKEELIKFSNIIEDLKQLGFINYDILKILEILMKFLKNDEKNKKLNAFLQLLEQLFII
ncbi:MAG: hypothetical protein ACFFDN_28750 [Candidatus Hodarchaeota archaeon]